MNLKTLEQVLSTPAGRKCISDILSLCGAGAFGPVGSLSLDWYTLGRRSVGEDIIQTVRQIEGVGTDGLSLEYKMLREKKEREKEEEI